MIPTLIILLIGLTTFGVSIIAMVKYPLIIKKILDHLDNSKGSLPTAYQFPNVHGMSVNYLS